jgi:hypothetical protein
LLLLQTVFEALSISSSHQSEVSLALQLVYLSLWAVHSCITNLAFPINQGGFIMFVLYCYFEEGLTSTEPRLFRFKCSNSCLTIILFYYECYFFFKISWNVCGRLCGCVVCTCSLRNWGALELVLSVTWVERCH